MLLQSSRTGAGFEGCGRVSCKATGTKLRDTSGGSTSAQQNFLCRVSSLRGQACTLSLSRGHNVQLKMIILKAYTFGLVKTSLLLFFHISPF